MNGWLHVVMHIFFFNLDSCFLVLVFTNLFSLIVLTSV
jgi:hypothetical protein